MSSYAPLVRQAKVVARVMAENQATLDEAFDVSKTLLDLIAVIDNLTRWRPVTEPPATACFCLVSDGTYRQVARYRGFGQYVDRDGVELTPTHWTPVIDKPTGDQVGFPAVGVKRPPLYPDLGPPLEADIAEAISVCRTNQPQVVDVLRRLALERDLLKQELEQQVRRREQIRVETEKLKATSEGVVMAVRSCLRVINSDPALEANSDGIRDF